MHCWFEFSSEYLQLLNIENTTNVKVLESILQFDISQISTYPEISRSFLHVVVYDEVATCLISIINKFENDN